MPQTITKGYKTLVDEANASIETLDVEAVQAMLGRDDVIIVDLRDPRELEREGRMPGAFHCPRGMLEFWIDPESPYAKPQFQQDKQFVFFCAGGWPHPVQESHPPSPTRTTSRIQARRCRRDGQRCRRTSICPSG